MKHLILALALACGGEAQDVESGGPDPGWCCDELCGLTAEETIGLGLCTCDAVWRAGECTSLP